MEDLLVRGAVICFQPQAGWSFDGFDGRVTLGAPFRGLKVGEAPVVLPADLEATADSLAGVAYKAQGFDRVAGTVIRAEVNVDVDSISAQLKVGASRVATAATHGTFKVRCRPSLSGSSPPVPDPQAASHSGTWKVVASGQDRLHAD